MLQGVRILHNVCILCVVTNWKQPLTNKKTGKFTSFESGSSFFFIWIWLPDLSFNYTQWQNHALWRIIKAFFVFIAANVGGYNGVFICGETPYFLFVSARGEPRIHPLRTDLPPAYAFAPFNNTNCAHGFLYFNSKVSLI